VGDTAEAVRIARVAKWTAIILGGIVLLLVAAVFVLTSVVNPNRYRGEVEAIVADLAGRPLVIEGDLKIIWYPSLGIATGPARLDNPPGVAGPPIMEWQSIEVSAQLGPLLRGQIIGDRIFLRSPRIHLRRDVQGHGNWEGLFGAPVGTAPGRASVPAPARSGAPGQKAVTSTRPVQIGGLELHDGMVDYVDEGSGLQASLSDVQADVGAWRASEPFSVHIRFQAHTQSLPPDGVQVALDSPALTLNPSPLTIAAPKLTVNVANAQAHGDVTYQTTGDAHTRAHGSVALHTPSLRKLLNDLALNQTLPHDPTTLGPLELTTSWSYDDGAIAAKPLALKLDGVSFNGWLQRNAAPEALWGFELHGDRIDLGRYVQTDSAHKKPFELPVEALRAVNANGSLIFDQVVLANTQLTHVRLKFETPEAKQ